MSKETKKKLEARVAALEAVVMEGKRNNWRLKRELDEVRHSIPLSVWQKRLRFIYPDLEIGKIEGYVAREAEERESWLLDRLTLTKNELLGVDE